MAKGGISGLSVAAIAAGGLLIVAGIRDAPVLDALRDILQGRTPTGRPPKVTDVGGAVGSAGGGAAGKFAPRPGTEFVRPVAGEVTSPYGPRNGRMHRGIDIAAPTGTPIAAAAAGEVTDTGYEPGGAGNFVKIKHDGSRLTKYHHLSAFAVSRGASVAAGQTIGYVGNTGNSSGPHLHFEVWINGQSVNPAEWI